MIGVEIYNVFVLVIVILDVREDLTDIAVDVAQIYEELFHIDRQTRRSHAWHTGVEWDKAMGERDVDLRLGGELHRCLDVERMDIRRVV